MSTLGYIEVDESEAGVEAKTIYVEANDRFIVSLIVGYDDETIHDTARTDATPRALALVAASAALQLTRDAGSSGTFWFVHDRMTGQTFEFEQGDFQEIPIE